MGCTHKRGDWIKEKSFWLCADCWSRLDSWPRRHGSPTITGEYRSGAPQVITWEAEKAVAHDGLSLNDFIRCMVRRFMTRTRPPMSKDDAYDLAIDVLKVWPDPFGHIDYNWSRGAAREIADEEMQYFERAEGN